MGCLCQMSMEHLFQTPKFRVGRQYRPWRMHQQKHHLYHTRKSLKLLMPNRTLPVQTRINRAPAQPSSSPPLANARQALSRKVTPAMMRVVVATNA